MCHIRTEDCNDLEEHLAIKHGMTARNYFNAHVANKGDVDTVVFNLTVPVGPKSENPLSTADELQAANVVPKSSLCREPASEENLGGVIQREEKLFTSMPARDTESNFNAATKKLALPPDASASSSATDNSYESIGLSPMISTSNSDHKNLSSTVKTNANISMRCRGYKRKRSDGATDHKSPMHHNGYLEWANTDQGKADILA